MTTESQQQIAREAADGIFDKPDLQHLIKSGMTRLEFRSIATPSILSAIERATDAKSESEFYAPKPHPAQPQRSEQCLVGYKAFMVCERGTKGCIAHHEQVLQRSEQQEWTKAYGPSDNCVQIGGLVFEVTMSASLIAYKINAALKDAYEKGFTNGKQARR